MNYNERITLIQPIIANNGAESETRTKIYAAASSVGYNEFYTATQAGFKPSVKFTIADAADYSDQPLLEWNGKRYNVVRTYKLDMRLELTCERVNNVNG